MAKIPLQYHNNVTAGVQQELIGLKVDSKRHMERMEGVLDRIFERIPEMKEESKQSLLTLTAFIEIGCYVAQIAKSTHELKLWKSKQPRRKTKPRDLLVFEELNSSSELPLVPTELVISTIVAIPFRRRTMTHSR